MYDYEKNALARRVRGAFASWVGYPGFSRVLAEFPELEAHLCGGSVRNLVLDPAGKPRDFDIFLNGPCLAEALDRLAQLGHMSKGVYGNIHWAPRAEDAIWADLVPVPRFHPVCPSRTVVDALNQFDYTGNAIAVNLRTGAVLDPQNGIRDMRRRIMRAVRFDHPDEPIVPGHVLRRPVAVWFRILNYATVLGLEIEPVTKRWLLAHREYFAYRDDFVRQFKVPHPDAFLLLEAEAAAGAGAGRLCGGAEPRLSFATV